MWSQSRIFIEQAAVVAGDVGGEEKQRLGVDYPQIIAADVPRHSQGGPLPPKKIKKPLKQTFPKVVQGEVHDRVL